MGGASPYVGGSAAHFLIGVNQAWINSYGNQIMAGYHYY